MKISKYLDSDNRQQMNKEVLTEDVLRFAEHFELREQLRSKSFLITGATGLIGSVLIRCLLSLNEKYGLGIRISAVVRSLDKAKTIFDDDYYKIRFFPFQLSDITQEHIEQTVDYVIHLASPTASKYFVEHPVETLSTAIDGTQYVLQYACETRVESMVFASSLEVYGSNHNDDLICEDFQGYLNPMEVRSSYNMGKRAAECLCHAYAEEYKVPVKIARLTQTTGAGIAEDDNRVIVQFTRLAASGQDIILHTTGEAARPYLYTTDAISAMLYILLKGQPGEAYNVANEETYISARGMAEYLRDTYAPAISVRMEIADNWGYSPITKLRLSTEKLQSLGWKPQYGLNEIFDRLIKYLS